MPEHDRRLSILFLCTGNSARSIMAESIANTRFGDRLEAVSAGSHPKGSPHPLAVATLRRHGMATEGLASKSWDVYKDRRFDLVVTLCASAAKEVCPVFSGRPPKTHWGFPDPPECDDEEAAFQRVFEGLVEAIDRFVTDEQPNVVRRAAVVAEHVAGEFGRE